MSAMSANAKLFYRPRKLLSFLPFFAFAYIVTLLELTFESTLSSGVLFKTGVGNFAFYLYPTFVFGLLGAGEQRNILAGPYSFLLPGHHEVPRRLLFRTGWWVSFLFSYTFLAYPDQTIPECLLYIVSGTFMGMTVYLLGVWAVFRPPTWGLGAGMLFLGVVAHMLFGVDILLETAITCYPVITIFVSGFIAFFSWRKLAGRDLARSSCTRRIHRREGKLYLSRISRCTSPGRGSYMWGAVYRGVGELSPLGAWWGLAPCVVLMCLWGYYAGTIENGLDAAAILVFPCLIGIGIPMPVYSTILLSAGRRERFWGGMAVMLAVGGFAMLLAAITAVVGQVLDYLLPASTLNGWALTYTALKTRDVFLPLLLVPVVFLPRLVFSSHTLAVEAISGIVQVVFFVAVTATVPVWLSFLHEMGPLFIAGLIAAAWLLAAAVLACICFRKDLVSQ